jgi:hypothetical protein
MYCNISLINNKKKKKKNQCCKNKTKAYDTLQDNQTNPGFCNIECSFAEAGFHNIDYSFTETVA